MGGGYVSKHKVGDCTQFCDKDVSIDDPDHYYYYEYDDYEQRRRRRQTDEVSYDNDPSDGIDAGGGSISKAWLYDGKDWKEIAPMTVTRDRPACSLLNMPNGKVI